MIFYSGQSTLENKKNNTYFEEKEQNLNFGLYDKKHNFYAKLYFFKNYSSTALLATRTAIEWTSFISCYSEFMVTLFMLDLWNIVV